MNRPIRVLHLTFNMGIGGTEQVIRQLVTGLDDRQVRPEILCIDGYVGPLGEQLQDQGIRITALSRQPGFDRALIRNIREVLVADNIDVVHCHQYTPWAYGWFAALGTGVKVVFTEHGRFHPDRYRYKAILVNQFMAWSTRAMVAISSATRDALARHEFIPRRRIEVVYNGIAPLQPDASEMARVREALSIPPQAFVVGTVSRLDPIKNQTMMLRAFARFVERCPQAYLLIVGDGPERQPLELLAEQLGVRDQVRFTGFIDAPVNHLALMDVFLLSSHSEGTSMTLLEAMSLGIAPVVTGVGGNPEIVEHERNGLVTRPGDEVDFADALIRLWECPEDRQALSDAARRCFQERFHRDSMLKAYQGIYQHCLPGRG